MNARTGFPGSLATLFLAAAVALLAGCSDEPGGSTQPPPPPAGDIDLEAVNGGITATPEAPAFGDATLEGTVAEEVPVADAIEDEPAVREMVNHPGARLYLLTAVWGILREVETPDGPSGDGTDTDWSGRVVNEHGAVAVRSVISFEREDGDAILARTRRGELAWTSYTGEGFDGLRLFLVRPPRLGDSPTEKDSVRFVAGPVTRTFAWSELEALEEELAVDQSGNRISFVAYRVDPTSAHLGGFLRGRWDAIPERDSVGRFQGVWVGQRGGAAGLFRGVYGTRASGEQVFFGKYIDAAGNFLGILRGHWGVLGRVPGPGDRLAAHGWFRGEWVNADGVRQGELHGRWLAPHGGPGFLQGRWCRGECAGRP